MDPNFDYVVGGWAIGNIVLLLEILNSYWVGLYFAFLPYFISLGYMAYNYTTYSLLVAGMSGMCWLFVGVSGSEYEGWATFFGVMTGLGGLLIIFSLWKNRQTVKETVQSGVEFVKTRRSKDIEELKF